MRIEDDFNYSVDGNSENVYAEKPWNYGKEIWCNLEGRYTHIRSNLSQYADQEYK